MVFVKETSLGHDIILQFRHPDWKDIPSFDIQTSQIQWEFRNIANLFKVTIDRYSNWSLFGLFYEKTLLKSHSTSILKEVGNLLDALDGVKLSSFSCIQKRRDNVYMWLPAHRSLRRGIVDLEEMNQLIQDIKSGTVFPR